MDIQVFSVGTGNTEVYVHTVRVFFCITTAARVEPGHGGGGGRRQGTREVVRIKKKKPVRKEIVGREASKEASQSVRGGVGDAEVGSGDYRLSGVFYL